MSCIAVSGDYVSVSRGMRIDCYKNSKHDSLSIPLSSKPQENDSILDIAISSDSKFLAAVSSVSKQLAVFDLLSLDCFKSFTLPRTASKVRFTTNNEQILVADKTGDVLLYDIRNTSETGTKLLGHLSLLLDILQTDDEKYIITSDRDEKIKVSSYPNTYNIQTYCLGHKEFVNHIEILPHDKTYLTSTSGDGTVKCWCYMDGRLVHNIDTNSDISDPKLKENFIKTMNEDGIEVNALPIVHYTISKLDDTSSLLVVAVHTCNTLLVYRLQTVNKVFRHELLEAISVDRFPTSIKLHDLSLYVYDAVENRVQVLDIQNKDSKINIKSQDVIQMFDKTITIDAADDTDSIKILYKRKFDNVQEYQERKKQRLEKTVT